MSDYKIRGWPPTAEFVVDAVARIEALEAALRIFASDEVWRHNGRCDPNSSNFDGQSIARAALDPASLLRQETTQGTAPTGSAGHSKDAGK